MKAHARSIAADDAPAEAAEIMRDENVGILPVFEGDRLAGMLTDRDIVVRAIAGLRDPWLASVREIMTPHTLFVFDHQSAGEAMQLMRESRVRRLPVFDHERSLVGILSASDLPDSASLNDGATSVLDAVTDSTT